MKTIKFRTPVWDYEDDKFLQFHYWGLWDNKYHLPNYMRADGERILNPEHQDQQFTGLKDKNGKEIYEGDIVKGYIPDSERDRDLPSGDIRFTDASFDIWSGENWKSELDNCTYNKSIEIIGNIYENPELLK